MIWLLCSDAVDISSLSVALITFVVCSHVMDILMCNYSIYQSPVYLCVVHYKRILHVSFVYECVFLIDPILADRFLFAGVPLRCIMRDVIANSAFLLISSVTLLESALLSIETSPSMSAIIASYCFFGSTALSWCDELSLSLPLKSLQLKRGILCLLDSSDPCIACLR